MFWLSHFRISLYVNFWWISNCNHKIKTQNLRQKESIWNIIYKYRSYHCTCLHFLQAFIQRLLLVINEVLVEKIGNVLKSFITYTRLPLDATLLCSPFWFKDWELHRMDSRWVWNYLKCNYMHSKGVDQASPYHRPCALIKPSSMWPTKRASIMASWTPWIVQQLHSLPVNP